MVPSPCLGFMTQHWGLRKTQPCTGSLAPNLEMFPVTVTTLCSLLSDPTVHVFTISVSGTQESEGGGVYYFNLAEMGISLDKRQKWLAHCCWYKIHVLKCTFLLPKSLTD